MQYRRLVTLLSKRSSTVIEQTVATSEIDNALNQVDQTAKLVGISVMVNGLQTLKQLLDTVLSEPDLKAFAR